MAQFDVIVYGASGYTGKLVAEYLAGKDGFKWAIAGRDKNKLENLRSLLAAKNQKLQNLDVFIADTSNYGSILEVTRKTKVLINCVGPFIKYGEPVVKACVESKTHYTDITGEPQFIRKMVDQYHEVAVQANVLIIPAAGFDSVPADLGVFFAGQRAGEDKLTQSEVFLKSNGGGLSNGTYATIIESLSRKAPKSKSTSGGSKVHPKNIQRGPHFSQKVNSWVFPFNFTSDPYVVTRTKRVQGDETFSYAQYLEMSGLFSVIGFAFVLIVFFILIKLPFGANLLRKLKQEGEGPSEDVRKKAITQLTFFSKTTKGEEVKSVFTGPEAYTATALFVAEAALALAQDEKSLPAKGGVLTPASALGQPYLHRLVSTGLIKFTNS